MASSIPPINFHPLTLHERTNLFTSNNTLFHFKSIPHLILQKGTSHFNISPLFSPHSNLQPLKASKNTNSDTQNTPKTKNLDLTILGPKPVKTIIWVLLWTSVSLVVYAFSKDTKASASTIAFVSRDYSIKASSFGVKVASFLRGSGWRDEVIVFALATLPVIELRGAIPVGYWMQLHPFLLTFLSIFGNMVPVPFIILYLKKFATFVAGKNRAASKILAMLLDRAKEKAGPVEEFQWLGLMLFVAVPFPGTGAWTGAIIASVLDMPFWPALSANFVGVVGAGLLVNLLVNLGLKYAIVTGVMLFVVSTFMWSVLRSLRKSVNSQK